jgi:hypothetical protein
LGAHFLFAGQGRVVDEGAALAVGREVAGGGILEAFDDGLPARQQGCSGWLAGDTHRLSRAIVADD